jgi:hypothetical protein
MKSKTTINLNKDTLILLGKIDKWLRDEYANSQNNDVVLKSREVISKIINRGYYNEHEQDLLNELRSQWIKSSVRKLS